MIRDDYEAQKRRLAEQRHALIEMAETAYQYQVRALDTVWRMMSGEGAGDLLPAPPPSPTSPPAPKAADPPVRPRRRLRAGELYDDIVNVLPQLADPFIHSDVSRARCRSWRGTGTSPFIRTARATSRRDTAGPARESRPPNREAAPAPCRTALRVQHTTARR